MKSFLLLLLTALACYGQGGISSSAYTVPLFYTTTAAGNGTTDDRAAIQSALDAASTAATAVGGRATVMLAKGKKYRLVPTMLTPTSGTAKYACLQIPNYVDFDLNGSVLEAYYTDGVGGDTTIGAVIVPKSLHTATSEYGAGSNWSIGNGRIQVFSDIEERTGNVLVFSRCQNVRWHNLTIGPRLCHAFEIQSGRGLRCENVTIETPTNTAGYPDIQFDYDGDAGTAKNANYTPTAPMEDMIFRRVKISGFPTYNATNGPFRRIEFGHTTSNHIVRDIIFDDCDFDGIVGPTGGNLAVSGDRHILDFNTHNSSGTQELYNITVRNCRFYHDVAGGSDSSCIALIAGGFSKANNILIENCDFTGTFIHGIILGSANGASPQDRHPELRRNIVVRNNNIRMGTWSTATSGGTYGPKTGALESGGSLCSGITAGSCNDVLIEGNLVIEPSAIATGHYMARTFRGFHIANNYSTILRNNRVEFWHRYSAANPAYGVFTGLSADCDEIINTLGLPCHYVCDGFGIGTRGIGCSGNATTDTFTCVGTNWLVDNDYVRIDFSGASSGLTSKTTGYQVTNKTATTFQLKAIGGATIDFGSNIGNAIVYLSYNWTSGYVEESLTAGAAVESRLTGYRSGISNGFITNYGGGGPNDIVLEMPIGSEKAVQASGTTTTPVTQNAMSGIVNFASGATSHTISNTMVTANTPVTATILTSGTSMTSVSVAVSANQIVITGNTSPGAECRVAWRIQ